MRIKSFALLLCLVAGATGFGHLEAQTAVVRATVSETIPHYRPEQAILRGLEVPITDAITDVGEEWTRGYRRLQPKAGLVFLPKLSVDEVKMLEEGSTSLILVGREMTADELKSFQTKYGYSPLRIPVAMDALIVFVNRANPITAISMAQLDAVYSRERRAGAPAPALVWGDLGVKGELANRTINAYARPEGTTMRTAFANQALLGGTFRPGIIDRLDNESLAQSITTDAAGIAFSSLSAWFATNKTLPVVPPQATDARYPTQEMVTSSKYPMQSLLYLYLNHAPGKPVDPAVYEALHYMLSQEGQSVVADVGLLPAPPEFVLAALRHLEH
jgi:phosphate transport system substrate-binding protein